MAWIIKNYSNFMTLVPYIFPQNLTTYYKSIKAMHSIEQHLIKLLILNESN